MERITTHGMAVAAQSLSGNAGAATQVQEPRPHTDLEDLRERLYDARREAENTVGRLTALVVKLRGQFAPSGEVKPSPVAPVATGLMQEFRELVAGLSSAQADMRSLLEMIETTV